ncbi:hypothetical protein LCGC14_2188500, partial [marine sediment metagenome]
TSGYDDWSEFTGTVVYQSASQGYDTTATHVEFASGIQVERKLFDDDQYNIMDRVSRDFAAGIKQTVESQFANVLNNAFTTTTTIDGVSLQHSSPTPWWGDLLKQVRN